MQDQGTAPHAQRAPKRRLTVDTDHEAKKRLCDHNSLIRSDPKYRKSVSFAQVVEIASHDHGSRAPSDDPDSPDTIRGDNFWDAWEDGHSRYVPTSPGNTPPRTLPGPDTTAPPPKVAPHKPAERIAPKTPERQMSHKDMEPPKAPRKPSSKWDQKPPTKLIGDAKEMTTDSGAEHVDRQDSSPLQDKAHKPSTNSALHPVSDAIHKQRKSLKDIYARCEPYYKDMVITSSSPLGILSFAMIRLGEMNFFLSDTEEAIDKMTDSHTELKASNSMVVKELRQLREEVAKMSEVNALINTRLDEMCLLLKLPVNSVSRLLWTLAETTKK